MSYLRLRSRSETVFQGHVLFHFFRFLLRLLSISLIIFRSVRMVAIREMTKLTVAKNAKEYSSNSASLLVSY